jgi:hypothetical protein
MQILSLLLPALFLFSTVCVSLVRFTIVTHGAERDENNFKKEALGKKCHPEDLTTMIATARDRLFETVGF